MRVFFCVLLLSCPLMAQSVTREASNGTFFVDGIAYHYAAGANCTVVSAVHTVLNHKFLAVKIRVYNAGQRSISVRPDDVVVEDAVGGHEMTAISAAELARRMRKPYNMARYAVSGGGPENPPAGSGTVNPQLMAMMQAMAAQGNGGRTPAERNVLYTVTPGALEDGDLDTGPVVCDQVCRLRNREAQGADALTQLQRQTSPESVQDYALLANTIPPRANVGGVLYYSLGKLSASADVAEHGKKGRLVRVTVRVTDENFQFELPVE